MRDWYMKQPWESKNITLSKRCQAQKNAYCTIPFVQTSKKILIYSDRKQIRDLPVATNEDCLQ